MKKLVPGSHGVYVTSSCEFSQWPSEVCDLPMFDNFVTITLYGREYTLDKTWVMLLAMFEIKEEDAVNNVRFVKLEYSTFEVPWRAVYVRPRYFDSGVRKYRRIPGYPRIAVGIDGICINTTNGRHVKQSIDAYGYSVVTTYDSLRNKHMTIGIHRLVAIAWIPEGYKDPNVMVNHIDGNKLNCHATNLEWTTCHGNNLHAIQNGLRPNCCACKLRDITTGEILEFPSIQETAAFLGYKNKNKESKSFGSTFDNKLYNEKYELRVGNDSRPWFYTGDKKIMSKNCSFQIITILDNGNTLVFHGTRDIIKRYGVWNSGGGLDAVLTKLKIIRPDLEILDVSRSDIVIPIQVKNVSSGEVLDFPSIRAAARDLKFPKTTISLGVRYAGEKAYKGFVMRYRSDDPWPIVQESKFKPVSVLVKDLSTQEETEYPSLKAVARALGIDRKRITRMLRYQKKGDRWKMSEIPNSDDSAA